MLLLVTGANDMVLEQQFFLLNLVRDCQTVIRPRAYSTSYDFHYCRWSLKSSYTTGNFGYVRVGYNVSKNDGNHGTPPLTAVLRKLITAIKQANRKFSNSSFYVAMGTLD
jgi:hypothetical protein